MGKPKSLLKNVNQKMYFVTKPLKKIVKLRNETMILHLPVITSWRLLAEKALHCSSQSCTGACNLLKAANKIACVSKCALIALAHL